MKSQQHLQDHTKESMRFTRRAIFCAIGIFIFILLISARLVYLQIIEHRFYATLSQKNVINVVPIKPDRGLIYDRNGVLLANNIPVYSLVLIPARINNLKKTIQQLTPIVNLTPDEITIFFHSLKNYRRFQEVPLKNKLSETELDQFYVNQFRFPGVNVKSNNLRNYPLGNLIGEITGYVGRINPTEFAQSDTNNYTASDEIGKSGVEVQNEDILHGTMGDEEAEIDARGAIVRVVHVQPPTPGSNIYLTVDSKLQALAKETLGNYSGAVVALKPDTGEVLALVTNPSYDPNAFVNGMSDTAYRALANAANHPLFNRALRGLYAPGSTVKPFIAASALEDHVVTPNVKINDPGSFQLPNTDHVFHDWKKHGHGTVNIIKAIIVSCDTFFYRLATVMGIDRLHDALAQFGFGDKTNIDLPGERAGIVPSPHWKRAYRGESWFGGDTVQTGIGQGYIVATPLQLAYATAIMAERGRKFQPRLILKIQNSNNAVTATQPIEQAPIVFKNADNWKIITEAMQGVVMDPQGTAWAFGKNAKYTVAAKTGTAQIFGHGRDEEKTETNIPMKLRNNHLFICFAPVDHPQIALAIVVEHAAFANIAARKLLDFYFQELAEQQKTSLLQGNSHATPTSK